MMEEWRMIEGYPDYMVSSMGRVKSLKYGKEKILKNCKNNIGYLLVILSKNGKRKTFYIHRLVAQAFLSNPNNLPEVNHKNTPTDNRVESLEWCDRKYNINYGTRNNKVSKALSIPILQFNLDGQFIKKWDSTMQIERELEIKHSNISSCCKGKLKSTGGYKWGYADDYERIPFNVFDLEIYRKRVA